MPDAERPSSASSYTDSSGSWKFEGAGITSSAGISNGTTTFEAFNVDEKRNVIPDSPYATAILITPCPFVSDPPNTEVFASVNDRQIFDGDKVSSPSIHFTYYIRDNFAPYAQFDCKLDEEPYEDCTIERCEKPGTCIPNTLWYGEKDYDNLLPGEHTFMVRATDDAGNTDPTPAEFTWLILKPIANAGPDQTVDSGATVQLDGSGSSANGGSPIANYQWTQTSGPTVTLDDPTSATPSFTAPETLVEENIVFELVVTNEDGVESLPDSVTITVNPVIPPPIADAGPDQTVASGATVTLDGSGSTDAGSPPLTYHWTQTDGPTVTLDDATSQSPTFTAPETQTQEDIVFQLIVTNEDGVESLPDSVTITVNPVIPPPTPPEPPIEGIIGSGNNINIQVQENSGNNADAHSGDGKMYSDESIFQGQSSIQGSDVVS